MASSIEYDLTLGQETVSTGVNKIVGSIAVLDSTMGKTGADIVKALDAGVAATNRLEAALSQTESRAKASGSGIGASLQKAFEFATGGLLAQGISKIGSSVLDLGKDTLDAAGTVEQAKIAYTGLLGSAAAANDELAKIRALANSTPFEFTQLTKAEQMMLAVGMSTDKARQSLIDAGNAVAAFGGSADQLNSVALAIEQVHSKGKLQGQEALQLVNAGIPVWQMMAAALHKTTAEVQDLSSQGKITADVFEQAFHTYSVERFGGAMEAQSHTWKGLLSTASDLGQTLEATFGTPVIEQLEPRLQSILDKLSDPAVATTLGQWADGAAKLAGALLDAAGTVGAFVGEVLTAIAPVTDALGQWLGTLGPAASYMQQAADSAAQIKTNFAPVPEQTKSAKDEAEGYQEVLGRIREQAQDVAYAEDQKIGQLREQATLLDRQYESSRKEADLHKAQVSLAGDRALAVNKFSRSGQEAARRVADDESRVQDLQSGIAHDAQKQAIDDRIAAVEEEKKALARKFDLEERGYQHLIDGLKKSKDATLDLGTTGQQQGQKVQTAAEKARDKFHELKDRIADSRDALRDLGTESDTLAAKAVTNAQAIATQISSIVASIKTSADPTATGVKAVAELPTAAAKEVREFYQSQVLNGKNGPMSKTNDQLFAEDPSNYTANPLDPGSYNPLAALGKTVGKISSQAAAGAYADNALSATRPPASMPLISGQSAQVQANRLTEQWQAKGFQGRYVMDRGHLTWQDGAGPAQGPHLPGRALGGPVAAGGTYLVGEHGPEVLQMGNQSGQVIPNGAYLGSGGGGAGGGAMHLTIEHLCPECLNTQIESKIVNGGQLIGQALGSYRRGRRR